MFLYTIWREREKTKAYGSVQVYKVVLLGTTLPNIQILFVVSVHTYTNCVASIPSITTKKPFYIYQYGQAPMMRIHAHNSTKLKQPARAETTTPLGIEHNQQQRAAFASKQLIAQFHDFHQAISFSYIQRTHM